MSSWLCVLSYWRRPAFLTLLFGPLNFLVLYSRTEQPKSQLLKQKTTTSFNNQLSTLIRMTLSWRSRRRTCSSCQCPQEKKTSAAAVLCISVAHFWNKLDLTSFGISAQQMELDVVDERCFDVLLLEVVQSHDVCLRVSVR